MQDIVMRWKDTDKITSTKFWSFKVDSYDYEPDSGKTLGVYSGVKEYGPSIGLLFDSGIPS